jgi:hypothetical protein
LAENQIELRKFEAVNGQQEYGNRFSMVLVSPLCHGFCHQPLDSCHGD